MDKGTRFILFLFVWLMAGFYLAQPIKPGSFLWWLLAGVPAAALALLTAVVFIGNLIALALALLHSPCGHK